MSGLESIAAAAAAQYGIPPDIFASLIQQESSWRTDAVSPAGAIGPAQLMPDTAAELGVDPYDPAQNIEGGARYLAQQYERFGSWPLALAAYNAGPGAVARYGGIPPYEETQAYVPAVLGRVGGGAEAMAFTPDPEQQPQGFLGRVGQGIGDLFQGFREAPETSQTDPFANLSRNQRMMLGFAALRDAAASLQGEQGGNFAEALGGFEAARERERLRTQGQAQSLMNLQQALLFAEATGDEATANLYRNLIAQTRAAMGGGAVPQPIPAGGVPVPTPETVAPGAVTPEVEVSPTAEPTTLEGRIADLDRRIAEADAATQDLTERAITGGITGLDYGPMIEQSRLEAERLRAEREALREEASGAAQEVETETRVAPLVEQALDFLVNDDGTINVLGARVAGAAPGIAGGEARLAASAISELGAIAAMDSVSSARERGFGGTLTDADIALIQRSGGIFDLSQPEATVQTLRRIASQLSPEAQQSLFGVGGETTPSGPTFSPTDEDRSILERYQ